MFGSTQASKPLFGASSTTTAPQSGGLFGSGGTSTGGLFGSNTQPQASGGLFGSTTSQPQAGRNLFGATTSQPQAGGGLLGNTTSQPQSSGGLFGATASQPQASGGLFGATASQPQQSGGLFGAAPATTQAQTGGLFGSAATTSQPQGGLFGGSGTQTGGMFGNTNTSQAAPSGGLFGGLGATQNQNTGGGGGLFGGTTSQAGQAGGLFSGTNNQNQAKPASTLFGGSTTQAQAQPLFSSLGQSQQQSRPGLGGSSILGGLGQSQNQQTVPGVRISTENIRGTTRFNDLHDELQKEIELMDKGILNQIDLSNQCTAILKPHEEQLSTIPNDVEFCRRKLIGLETAMASDSNAIANLQKLIKIDIEHGQLSGRAIENLRLPIQYHVSGVWPPKNTPPDDRSKGGEGEGQDFVGYFSSTADELAVALEKDRQSLSEIELHLRSVEATSGQQIATLIARKNNGGAGFDDNTAEQLASALVEFEQGILHVASKVGAAREGVQTLQLDSFGNPHGGSTIGKSTTGKGKRSGIF